MTAGTTEAVTRTTFAVRPRSTASAPILVVEALWRATRQLLDRRSSDDR
jgi:hypothetical protein